MRHSRLAGLAALSGLLALMGGGCSSPEVVETPRNLAPPSPEKERARTAALEERMRALKTQVDALPDKTPLQLATKAKVINLWDQARVEALKKNPLEGAIPQASLPRIGRLLDEVEKEIQNFPK